MKKLFSISVCGDTVDFGIASEKGDIEQMFHQRYEAYLAKGHIAANMQGSDKDAHDFNGSCIYFIAKNKDKLIGSLRIIKEKYLPTEMEYYSFIEPPEIAKIPRDERIEIGRLVSTGELKGAPRHLILMGLFSAALKYCLNNDIKGGYGTLKDYVKAKLDKIAFPIQGIKDAKFIYEKNNQKDPLGGFFDSKNGVTYPVFFLEEDVNRYLDGLFKFAFRKSKDNVYILKNSKMIYIYFLIKKLGRMCE